MAGQARRGIRRHGPSFKAGSSRARAAGSVVGSGFRTTITSAHPVNQSTNREATRVTYRSLLLRGLAPDEAANLTAFLSGIPVGAQHWKLLEVNRLLFLRELREAGGFGTDDGASPLTA
jgi:hypothetical protein